MIIEHFNNSIVVDDIHGDMGEHVTMKLHQQEDGDVILVLVTPMQLPINIEFCTSNGGGRYPIIAKKLRELISELGKVTK